MIATNSKSILFQDAITGEWVDVTRHMNKISFTPVRLEDGYLIGDRLTGHIRHTHLPGRGITKHYIEWSNDDTN